LDPAARDELMRRLSVDGLDSRPTSVREVISLITAQRGGIVLCDLGLLPSGPLLQNKKATSGKARQPAVPEFEDETVAVRLGGVTQFVRRSQVKWIEAAGDYARLHTTTGHHLLRTTLRALEKRWLDSGFLRVHRSVVVALGYVTELELAGGQCTLRIDEVEIPVSRRRSRVLRDLLREQDIEAGGSRISGDDML
jgi:hypothetical protein